MLEELKGRIYFNPLIDRYEIADKFIAGNVIEKADRVQTFLNQHPDDEAIRESLEALRAAAPKPIAFDDLDFNFGERWIPKGVYEKFASSLFDTEVKVSYALDIDEYSVKASLLNAKILNQYAVDSQSRKYNGIHLLKHALQNTSPDNTKKVTKLIDRELKEVKVRDGEAIQLANSKIDEIRNAFPEWLREQTPDFKDRLIDLYNRTFNCFVRPKYDGLHGARSGSYVPLRNDRFQLPDGAVSAVQIPASEGAGAAEHPHVRRVGGHLRQEDHRLRVLRNQRGRAERAVPLLHQSA